MQNLFVFYCFCLYFIVFVCNFCVGCIDGEVRLAGGANNSEGRVEVCVKGAWTTVCDEGWNDYAAKVICKEIGLPHAGNSYD